MPFQIGNRQVGDEFPPLIIAEIGINHNGCLKTAKEMVDAAFSAGVEVVKHQTHVIDDEMSATAKKVIPGNADKSIYEIMEDCALDEKDESRLKSYVESKGMLFISTPFSREAAFRLERLGVDGYKIGSGECNNYPLIELIASFGKPMIVSTGMNDIASIKKTENILKKANVDYCFLHTTNLYPTPPSLVRLGAMQEMMRSFPGVEIGLSDHTTNNLACFSAVALGANILERHFTDSADRIGPDIVNSMTPVEASDLIIGANEIKLMRGGEKAAAAEEQVTMDFAFSTVVAIKPIKAGDTLSNENIWVKRPGTGAISAEHFNGLLGVVAKKDVEKDQHLDWSDVEC